MTVQQKSGTMDNQSTKHKGQAVEIDTGQTKWQAQELGVNSNIPLVDEGKGKPYIVRQFEFHFNPDTLNKIKQKKIPAPTRQELFNAHWRQIQTTLWGDGLVACQEVDPRMIIGKKKYKIILLCEPRFRTMVAEKPNTLQEITKSLT